MAKKKTKKKKKATKKKSAGDPRLLGRLRTLVARRTGVTEKRMFGGYCFLADGNMCFGVTGDDELMVRVGPDAYEAALEKRHAREMKFTGRPLRGFVYVAPPGIRTKAQLLAWVDRGLKFARSLPPK